ncbi:peptidoglycan-binding domain-containing protein [Streptomyces sp. NPDC005485]|uniref:peptidoglycan-binding domain-containing protein n=1 Tax=Streptomyces sp. NPDC005485 TaxID=3155591 RepID=UPI0033B0642F
MPPKSGRPAWRPALEPTRVQLRRRSEALAELVRQVRENDRRAEPEEHDELVEPVAVAVATAPRFLPTPEDNETEELPPVATETARLGSRNARAGAGPRAGGRHSDRGREAVMRRTAIGLAVLAAALAGFAAALLLPGDDTDKQARTSTPPSTAPGNSAPSGAADPDGAGTLREGDSGPEVTELQQRLLRIPDVYGNGATSGTYDATLSAAVARFQLWYGIRGDETGVYGDDTRRDLESRTTP